MVALALRKGALRGRRRRVMLQQGAMELQMGWGQQLRVRFKPACLMRWATKVHMIARMVSLVTSSAAISIGSLIYR
jgi:hypothetical protein